MKVDLDTSVLGGCFDPQWAEWSNRLMQEFRSSRKTAVISDGMPSELQNAPAQVRDLLQSLPSSSQLHVFIEEEARELADRYIAEGALTFNMLLDARHIAPATGHRVDVLVSRNFRHIVNFNRIRLFNAVNLKAGYPLYRDPQSPGGPALKDQNKDLDAVQMTREIRDRMAERYRQDPEAERRDLEEVWRKYGLSPPLKSRPASVTEAPPSSAPGGTPS
jgi:hypothetical protein